MRHSVEFFARTRFGPRSPLAAFLGNLRRRPLLASRLGVAMVEGYQNGDVPFAATLKHFFGYGFSLSGKDRTPAWIPERELREYFLPSFQAAIDAGAMSIMVNSGEINGIPVHANRYLLTDCYVMSWGSKAWWYQTGKTFAISTIGTWWPKTTKRQRAWASKRGLT